MGMALKNAINGLEHMAAPFKRFFNMVEVTLALAVVGIGISGIMALFPVAIQSSRDSIGDNYSSDVADQFLSYLTSAARQLPSGWSTVILGATKISETMPSDPPTVIDGEPLPSGWINPFGSSSTAYVCETGTPGLYGVKVGNDFICHARVWKSKVEKLYYFDGTNASSIDIPYDYAARLYVEISYPATKSYAARVKRNYTLEVFNQ